MKAKTISEPKSSFGKERHSRGGVGAASTHTLWGKGEGRETASTYTLSTNDTASEQNSITPLERDGAALSKMKSETEEKGGYLSTRKLEEEREQDGHLTDGASRVPAGVQQVLYTAWLTRRVSLPTQFLLPVWWVDG